MSSLITVALVVLSLGCVREDETAEPTPDGTDDPAQDTADSAPDDTGECATLPQWVDADADGYGDDSRPVDACAGTAGVSELGGDCDDADATVNPAAIEVCFDGLDNDCDGTSNGCGWEGDFNEADAVTTVRGTETSDLLDSPCAVGDQNGDGVGELLVAARGAGTSGEVYVFFGQAAGENRAADADITFTQETDGAGFYMGTSGRWDFDGDAVADITVADAYVGDDDHGELYVFYGPVSGIRDGDSADLVFEGGDDDHLAWLTGGGDFNGDGSVDLAYSAHSDSVRVWLGPTPTGVVSGLPDVSLDVDGDLGDWVMGDIDGDGIDDALIGTSGYDERPALLVLGGELSGAIDAAAAATASFAPSAINEGIGEEAALCDVDGDGLLDVAVSADDSQTGMSSVGEVYVFFAAALAGATDVGDADVTLTGDISGDYLGVGLDCQGDIDGGGFDDLVMATIWDDTGAPGAGTGYVYFGPLAGALGERDADVRFIGTAADRMLVTAAVVGDITGDGAPDFAFGSYSEDDGRAVQDVGAVWVLPGGGR